MPLQHSTLLEPSNQSIFFPVGTWCIVRLGISRWIISNVSRTPFPVILLFMGKISLQKLYISLFFTIIAYLILENSTGLPLRVSHNTLHPKISS